MNDTELTEGVELRDIDYAILSLLDAPVDRTRRDIRYAVHGMFAIRVSQEFIEDRLQSLWERGLIDIPESGCMPGTYQVTNAGEDVLQMVQDYQEQVAMEFAGQSPVEADVDLSLLPASLRGK